MRILRREAFVIVVVARQDDVRAGPVQQFPGVPHHGNTAMSARTIQRVVPVSERAARRPGVELQAQPCQLGCAGGARQVAVEGNDAPVAQLHAVPGGLAKVVEVAARAGGAVFVVAGRGVGAVLEAAPGRAVAGDEILQAGAPVDVVAQGQHRGVGVGGQFAFDQPAGFKGARPARVGIGAVGDVARRVDGKYGSARVPCR